eukprot:TRINITY_DN2584_c0_g1_i3.p1 TRINITY_DN2584_c0_g1~~TRINITY_DN2584_c0_g1_i3.p1  ORF type:complete len:388 (-),score=100.15 TRINITY_DN2584_c0_g1_i3:111-1274(-)
MPVSTPALLQQHLDIWSKYGVEGHFKGDLAWATMDSEACELSVPIVGAKDASEIAIMNSLTCNLHLMMCAFYRPTAQRHKIVIEDHAFCSDMHAVRSQIALHGFNPDQSLIKLTQTEVGVCHEEILEILAREGQEIALVILPGVQYYTGQVFDMAAITEAGHAQGCVVGFDLAHAVGNIPLKLHDWDVDFAVWCSYKYLNSGPGSVGGCFVHERHGTNVAMPRLAGWFGQDPAARFAMGEHHVPKVGAQGFQLSNFPVLPMLCYISSLRIFQQATFDALRQKSILLTGYLEALLQRELGQSVRIVTPSPAHIRGCQLSLFFTQHAAPAADEKKTLTKAIHSRLGELGVICDYRHPNAIRVAPVPLYNSFQDVHRFVSILKQIVQEMM